LVLLIFFFFSWWMVVCLGVRVGCGAASYGRARPRRPDYASDGPNGIRTPSGGMIAGRSETLFIEPGDASCVLEKDPQGNVPTRVGDRSLAGAKTLDGDTDPNGNTAGSASRRPPMTPKGAGGRDNAHFCRTVVRSREKPMGGKAPEVETGGRR
jgi:hypothetical protein